MINMRIDIIRKELDQRVKEVEELKNEDYEEVEKAISRFLYFLLSEPATKDFILDLSRYDVNFIKSDEFIIMKKEVTDVIKTIIGEIDRSGMINKAYKQRFQTKHPMLSNLFGLPDPDVNKRFLSLGKFLQALRDFDKYSDCILSSFNHIMNYLNFLFENGIYYKNSKINANVINNSIDKIKYTNLKLEAKFQYQAEYDSANSLHRLLGHMHIAYRFLLIDTFTELGKEKYFRGGFERDYSESDYLVKDCRNVYHAVDRFLSSSKSKSFLIDRLLTYCRWIKREEFPKPKEKNLELKISRVIEEFLFNHGYFPLVNFKMGKSIPDILSAPGIDLRWDNSVLIELKQIIGKTSYSSSDLETDIGQAQDYLSDVKGINPDIVDTVYLLIFYDGKTRRTIPESVDVPDNVRVEFVYVGKETPSKLKSPKTTAKKKIVKKKATKKSTRKK